MTVDKGGKVFALARSRTFRTIFSMMLFKVHRLNLSYVWMSHLTQLQTWINHLNLDGTGMQSWNPIFTCHYSSSTRLWMSNPKAGGLIGWATRDRTTP
jgi:hypothetical protein